MHVRPVSQDVSDWSERVAAIYGEIVPLDAGMREVLIGLVAEALNPIALSRPHDFSHWPELANAGLDAFEDRFHNANGPRIEVVASRKNLHLRCRR